MRRLVGAVALLVMLALAPAARADISVSIGSGDVLRAEYFATLKVSGELKATLAPDPGTCARFDRCDVQSATIEWTPDSDDALGVFVYAKGKATPLAFLRSVFASNHTNTTIVRPDGTCTDDGAASEGSLVGSAHGKEIRFGFGDGAQISATRCGGPLASELVQDFKDVSATFPALRARATTLDLGASHVVTAGGLTGTVTSDIRLRIGRLKAAKVAKPRPASDGVAQPSTVSLGYKITRVSGSVSVAVSPSAGGCKAYDSCDTSGALTLTPGPATGQAYAFPDGKIASGAGAFRGTGTLAARYGSGCRDERPLRNGSLGIGITAKAITAAYSVDSLATRCAGPLGDKFEGAATLATGKLPRTALRAKTLTLHLNGATTYKEPGYRLRSEPDITVVLRRTKISAR